jgi:mannose-1-phosphate guanylyltransferase/mannose-6-phosphate isomerase
VEAVSNAVANAGRDLGFVTLEPQAFGAAKAISIDYAVMEKTSRAAVVPVSCGWSDVGSWHAVWELSDKDTQGNAAHGTAVFEDSRNCNVTSDHALVALEASMTSLSWRPRMRCWSRGRRTPMASSVS